METYLFELFYGQLLRSCSKPTVWDGDPILWLNFLPVNMNLFSCSKPTVWDGDSTAYPATLPVSLFGGSKPTVWDGDQQFVFSGDVPCTKIDMF